MVACDEPNDMRSGDVAGFNAFLDWITDGRSVRGLSANTVMLIRSTWRNVVNVLQLPARDRIVDVRPEELLERFASRRGAALHSSATYLVRLRRGLEIYKAYLSADPDWRAPAPSCRQTRTSTGGAATRAVTFPLRPNLTIVVELPTDLGPDEAKLLAAWLAGYASR